MIWRTPGKEFDPKCTISTVKYRGDSVMVWDCFTHQTVGKLCAFDRIIDRFYYRDILEQNLQPLINRFKLV